MRYKASIINIILFFNATIHQLVVMKSGARVSFLLVWYVSGWPFALLGIARFFAFYAVSIFVRMTNAFSYIGINTNG